MVLWRFPTGTFSHGHMMLLCAYGMFREASKLRYFLSTPRRSLGAAVLPNGRILSWSNDKTLRMWDGKSGAPLELLAGHSSGVKGAIVLSDGCILSWAHFDTLRLWDGERGAFLKAFGEPLPIDGMLVISDQKLLSWLWSKWNLESSLLCGISVVRNQWRSYLAILDGVGGTALLTDGLVLSWSRDGTLRIWNIKMDYQRGRYQGIMMK